MKTKAVLLLAAVCGLLTAHPLWAFNLQQAWQDYARNPPQTSASRSFPFQACFERAAATHQLPLSLLLAVARGESDFDPVAISSENAIGLMQIQWPGTGRHLGIRRQASLFDPCTNAEAGARYLKQLIERYDGDLHLALAAYNYGPGRIRPDRVPDGAAWYSEYIHRHLQYVIGTDAPALPPRDYRGDGRDVLITFSSATHARQLLAWLEPKVPGVQLDWFRAPLGRHQLVLRYQDEDERDRGLQLLRAAGFLVSN